MIKFWKYFKEILEEWCFKIISITSTTLIQLVALRLHYRALVPLLQSYFTHCQQCCLKSYNTPKLANIYPIISGKNVFLLHQQLELFVDLRIFTFGRGCQLIITGIFRTVRTARTVFMFFFIQRLEINTS